VSFLTTPHLQTTSAHPKKNPTVFPLWGFGF